MRLSTANTHHKLIAAWYLHNALRHHPLFSHTFRAGSLWSLKHSSFTGSWHSRHQCRCGGRLILESSWQGLHTLVVPGKAVDTALHQNQAELGILVFAILVQVLPHGHCLLDQVVQILRESWCHAVGLEDSQHVVASHSLDLWHTEAVSQGDTNLGRSQTLLGQLADVINHIIRLHLQPAWRSSLVGDGG